MITEKRTHWQDWGNIVIGLLFLASPFLVQYPDGMKSAILNAYVFGAAIAVLGICAVLAPKAWEEIINIVLGLWIMASPWILGFASEWNARVFAVVAGGLVALLAAWAMIGQRRE